MIKIDVPNGKFKIVLSSKTILKIGKIALPSTLTKIIQLNILVKPDAPSLPNICLAFDKIDFNLVVSVFLLSLLSAEMKSKDISFLMINSEKTDNKKVTAFTIATNEKF